MKPDESTVAASFSHAEVRSLVYDQIFVTRTKLVSFIQLYIKELLLHMKDLLSLFATIWPCARMWDLPNQCKQASPVAYGNAEHARCRSVDLS